MLTYNYICSKCTKVKANWIVDNIDEEVLCKCGAIMKRQFPCSVQVEHFPIDGIRLEHVSPTGETFHSKRAMRKYAHEHDLDLGYLL